MSFGIFNQIIAETAVLAILGLLVATVLHGRIDWGWFAAAVAFFFVHKLVLFLGLIDGILPNLIGGRYNWEGKIAGTIFSLVFGSFSCATAGWNWG